MSQGTGTAKLWHCWWSAACQLSICRKKTHRFSVFTLVYNQLYRLSTTSSFCCSPDHEKSWYLWPTVTLPSFWSKLQYSLRCFSTLKKTPQTFHQTSTKLYIQWNFTSAIPINESLVLKAILSLHTNSCGRCNLQSLHFFWCAMRMRIYWEQYCLAIHCTGPASSVAPEVKKISSTAPMFSTMTHYDMGSHIWFIYDSYDHCNITV